MPFLIFIVIVVVLGGYGVIRSMKAGGGTYAWLLAVVVLVAIGIGFLILQSRQKAEPITISADRIGTPSWSIPFSQIYGVREDQVTATQYSGGRPVVSTQRRLLVDTDEGSRVIAYEATYDIETIKSAIETALVEYKKRFQ
ncbi:MAG: hypothetical protein QME81_05175 [bacterium]|nr:hypothetical protein [bacterium]